jgi:hypothetical protein
MVQPEWSYFKEKIQLWVNFLNKILNAPQKMFTFLLYFISMEREVHVKSRNVCV